MKPLKDYSFLKGVNYEYEGRSEAQWRSELAMAQRVGLNSLRIWLRYGGYRKDPQAYIAYVRGFFRVAGEMGFTVMPILFNGNEIDAADPYQLNPAFLPDAEAYVRDVVAALKDDPALIMYDMMNEPGCNHLIWDAKDDAERGFWLEKHWTFLRHMCRYIRTLDKKNALTVGYWLADHAGTLEKDGLLDVISYHDYSPSLKGIRTQAEMALKAGETYALPVLNTETGCIGRGNPYDLVLQTMAELHIPTYIYGLTADGYWLNIHGIFYADGTVRDPAAVAALLGFFRNRDYETIVPEMPNRERNVKKAIDKAMAVLGENDYGADGFRYEAITAQTILDVCDELACFLEAGQLVPMRIPPTAKVAWYRKQPNPNMLEVREFCYALARQLKEGCQLL